ncbi:MAG: bifunctional demethylmenaquinone methyltransferase/2-methoxy-6-polyprenyl-1,4-benzoquinol methylase UbiE [Flavobacteriales bacterium]
MSTIENKAEAVKPYSEEGSKTKQIATMFDNIAHRYDFLNRSLSMGIDIIWRKKAIAQLKEIQPKKILDVATGTGDFAIEAMSLKPEKITGVDISVGMLELGKEKIAKKNLSKTIEMVVGDSENLPFEDNTYDAATVAFGVRNFENLQKGLTDINRVLRPGGKLVILELSTPKKFPIKQLFGFYFNNILPLFGKMLSKDDSAYTYLPMSVNAFPDGEDFKKVMAAAGFQRNTSKALTFGICSLYTGVKA